MRAAGSLRVLATAGVMLAAWAVAADPLTENEPAYPGITCDLFGPTFTCPPYLLYGPGQELQVTVLAHQAEHAGPAAGSLNTLRDLFGALRACWKPPAVDEGRPGMELTVRFSLRRDGSIFGSPRFTYMTRQATAPQRDLYRRTVIEGLQDCAPLAVSQGLGGAIAGRPIVIRYIDDRRTRKSRI